jgi:hypothetical protein
MSFDNREGKTTFCKTQKGFVPGIGGCSQHTFIANTAISHAINENRQIYVVALDMKDAFGSVAHLLWEYNLTWMNLPEQ